MILTDADVNTQLIKALVKANDNLAGINVRIIDVLGGRFSARGKLLKEELERCHHEWSHEVKE